MLAWLAMYRQQSRVRLPLSAAGHDTSAATLMRLFKEMGTQTGVMERLRAEQQKACSAALTCRLSLHSAINPLEGACYHLPSFWVQCSVLGSV